MATPLTVIPGISIDDTNSSDPILKIPYSAVAAAISWTNAPTAINAKLDPWIIGILQVLANYATNNPTNETNNIVVQQPSLSTPTTRNGVANRKNSRYTVTAYSESTINPVVDGDEF